MKVARDSTNNDMPVLRRCGDGRRVPGQTARHRNDEESSKDVIVRINRSSSEAVCHLPGLAFRFLVSCCATISVSEDSLPVTGLYLFVDLTS